MTTNLWTVGQGLVTRRLAPKPMTPPENEVVENAAEARGTATATESAPSAAAEGPTGPAARRRRKKKTGTTVSDDVTSRRPGRRSARRSGRRCASSSGMHPGLDKASVRFEVVTEGERGLLGVGYAPARVRRDGRPAVEPRAAPSRPRDESELAADVRGLVEQIVAELGVHGRVEVREDADGLSRRLLRRRRRRPDRPLRPDDRRGAVPRERDRRAARGRADRGDGRRCRATASAGARSLERLAVRSAERARSSRRAGRARADDGGGAQGRPPPPQGARRRRDVERGHGAEPLRRHQPRLERWLDDGSSSRTPGLTAIDDVEEARRVLLEDSLRGLELVRREAGPVVDVGSGGGAPGIPLALALPEREFVLLEAQERKCAFLREHAPRERARRAGPRRGAGDGLGRRAPSRRRSRRRRLRRSGACRSCVPGGAVVLWVGPSAEPRPRRRGGRAAGGRARGRSRRLHRPAQGRARRRRAFRAVPGSPGSVRSRS